MTEETILLVFAAIVLALGAAAFVIARKWAGRYQQADQSIWAEMAQKIGGTLEREKGDPKIRFQHKGKEAVYRRETERIGRQGGVYLQLEYPLEGDRSGGIRLVHQDMGTTIDRAIWMQDIRTQDPAFDRLFIVQGKDEIPVRNFLREDVRQALVGLTDGGRHWIKLQVHEGKFSLGKCRLKTAESAFLPESLEEVSEFLDKSRSFLDRFEKQLEVFP